MFNIIRHALDTVLSWSKKKGLQRSSHGDPSHSSYGIVTNMLLVIFYHTWSLFAGCYTSCYPSVAKWFLLFYKLHLVYRYIICCNISTITKLTYQSWIKQTWLMSFILKKHRKKECRNCNCLTCWFSAAKQSHFSSLVQFPIDSKHIQVLVRI